MIFTVQFRLLTSLLLLVDIVVAVVDIGGGTGGPIWLSQPDASERKWQASQVWILSN